MNGCKSLWIKASAKNYILKASTLLPPTPPGLGLPGDPVHREPLQRGAAEDHGPAPQPHPGGRPAAEPPGGKGPDGAPLPRGEWQRRHQVAQKVELARVDL